MNATSEWKDAKENPPKIPGKYLVCRHNSIVSSYSVDYIFITDYCAFSDGSLGYWLANEVTHYAEIYMIPNVGHESELNQFGCSE